MGFFVTKFTETFASDLPEAQDGVIRGAKLIGLTSRNGRLYKDSALKSAASLYEGRKVYVNHPKPGDSGDRQFADWAGVIENVSHRKGEGLYGDIVLRKGSPYFEGILEVASNPKFRKSCGFSHVAEGESTFDDAGTEIIESIKEVFSVDLVTDPATTRGIFESVRTDAFNEAIKSLLESCEPVRARLEEMAGAGFMGDDFTLGGPEKEVSTDPLDKFASLAMALTNALADVAKAVAKANKPDPVIPAPPAAPGEKPPEEKGAKEEGSEEEDDMTEEDKNKIAAFESLQRENAELKASKLLLESGRAATPVRMKALANCTNDEEQRELIESWPKVDDTGRPARSPALLESEGDFPRGNPKKFAALLR